MFYPAVAHRAQEKLTAVGSAVATTDAGEVRELAGTANKAVKSLVRLLSVASRPTERRGTGERRLGEP